MVEFKILLRKIYEPVPQFRLMELVFKLIRKGSCRKNFQNLALMGPTVILNNVSETFNRMEYVLTENNYDEWHKDFILELQDLGLCEYVEKNIEDIIKEGNDILSKEGEDKIKEHKMNNFKVLSFLRKSVDTKIKSFIRSKEEDLEKSIKETNLIEPESSIIEINLCEINTTSEDNNDKQYLEFETINDKRQINYDTNYYNNSNRNSKFKTNNTPNKTENTNIFQKENNTNYNLNNYLINDIYDGNKYNISNYKDIDMNNNKEITSMNNNNVSNSYQNNENKQPVMIDKCIVESFLDKINKTKCKLNKLLKCLNEINKKNNTIHKIIKDYLQVMNFDTEFRRKLQNLKFNYNVHEFEFKSDSLAEKNLGCTTTDK
ncbi:hypothetical protein H8356DRAFT_1400013 [Neocallimastix lanati (nom. inval.)]|nr:hypothetical protein H8356DRAFT_1400013 [Neocallimastix sp. JGI-2020a]